jgi:hypothetical protein
MKFLGLPTVWILLLFVGCSSRAERSGESESIKEGVEEIIREVERSHGQNFVVDKTPALNDIIIYPVKTGRAEDLAATLEPILLGRYGPGVTVIAHTATNQILIKLPNAEDREAFQRQPQATTRPRSGTRGQGR